MTAGRRWKQTRGRRPRRLCRQDLWLEVYQRFGVSLPWKSFTPGHSSPLGFLWDAWSNPGRDVAAWACRSGGKTLSASILAGLEFLDCERLQARVLSGSEDQARYLYDYWSNWCRGPLAGRVDGEITRVCSCVGGGRMEILPASQKKVRGGKVQRLFEDELDEIDPAIDAAAVGMLAGRPGRPARTVYTSTWHRVDGPMGRLVAGADQRDIRLHRWNIWEAIANCPPERHEQGRGCETCPLGTVCVPKARQVHDDPDRRLGIAAEAVGLYQVEDVCKAFRKVSRTVWRAEYECRRPSVEGLVYPAFDESTHVRDSAPQDLEIYRAIDWGFGVFVCLWLGVDKDATVWLLDTYKAEGTALAQHAEYILAHRLQNVRATYCDPAGRNRNDQTGRSNIEEFRQYNIPCSYTLDPAAREVANGVRLVRSLLAPATGRPRLYVLRGGGNEAFIRDIQSYRNRKVNDVYLDEPLKPQPADHTMDALRYFAVNRLLARRAGAVRLGAR